MTNNDNTAPISAEEAVARAKQIAAKLALSANTTDVSIDSNKRKSATAIDEAGSFGEFSVDFRDIAVKNAGLEPNNLKSAGLDPNNVKKSGFHATA